MFEDTLAQGSLFGGGSVGFDHEYRNLERHQLDEESWLDHAPMWLHGDEELFRAIADGAEWTQPVVPMYDRKVVTPRLVARLDADPHPVIPEIIDSLTHRYRVRLDQVSAGWYRDGQDSVAFHGDRIARERPQAIVATVSLGGVRRFLIRPKTGGESRAFSLGHGDLVVMGGACQRDWEHAVPKVARAEPRIALMFRHRYE